MTTTKTHSWDLTDGWCHIHRSYCSMSAPDTTTKTYRQGYTLTLAGHGHRAAVLG